MKAFSWIRAQVFRQIEQPSRLIPILAIVIGMGLRLFLAARYISNYNEASYEIVSRLVSHGQNIYVMTNRYNYSPLWSLFLFMFAEISNQTHLHFHLVVWLFLSLVDLSNAIIIGAMANRIGSRHGYLAFSAYLMNPVAIFTVGYQGQFDNFAVLPILLATYAFLRSSRANNRVIILALGTIALLIKHIVVFGVWSMDRIHLRVSRVEAGIGNGIRAISVRLLIYSIPSCQTDWYYPQRISLQLAGIALRNGAST